MTRSGGRDCPYDLQQSHGDNTGKMTMNTGGDDKKKGNRKGQEEILERFDGEEKERS